MKQPNYNTDKDLFDLVSEVSNWKKWGDDDQLGTLNYISPEHILEATALIKKGRVISLARETILKPTDKEGVGERDTRYKEQDYRFFKLEEGYANDYTGFIFHGHAFTHLDALCHVFALDGKLYNGYDISDLTDRGANKLGVEQIAQTGIIGRGVLLDITRVRGRDLDPGEIIYLDDLREAEKIQNSEIKSGDILFVRSGAGERNLPDKLAGLHPECIPWLHEKEVSMLGNDGGSDYFPNHYDQWLLPLHEILIPYMGMPLLDNVKLDELSNICEDENRWEFFVTIAPWNIRGVTGSPINPLAVF